MDEYDFSAKAPTLGYMYQIRYGLYLLLSLSLEENNVKLLLESLDDIEIRINDITQLNQAKYHVKNTTNLTDRSPDLWKTIRVWSEQITSGLIDINNTIFSLITTQNISENSIIAKIKNQKEDDLDNVLLTLNTIADETNNKTNQKGYSAFKALCPAIQKRLIQKIRIVDSSLDFSEIESKIKSNLRYSALPNQMIPMFERLDGWFFGISVELLLGRIDFIGTDSLQRKILEISDSFKQDNLPNDFSEKIDPTSEELAKLKNMTFLKQLNLINVNNKLHEIAKSDYYRAFNQRSKWLKDDLLNPEEEINFEKKLVDDWERKFTLMEAPEKQSPKQQLDEGNTFFKKFYVENSPTIFIRERFQEKYLTLGSCHILSDKLKIGWHPNFYTILKDDDDS